MAGFKGHENVSPSCRTLQSIFLFSAGIMTASYPVCASKRVLLRYSLNKRSSWVMRDVALESIVNWTFKYQFPFLDAKWRQNAWMPSERPKTSLHLVTRPWSCSSTQAQRLVPSNNPHSDFSSWNVCKFVYIKTSWECSKGLNLQREWQVAHSRKGTVLFEPHETLQTQG